MAALIREWDTPLSEWGVVAPTFGAARDVCIEGRSGVLKALGLPSGYRGWNRSNGQLHLPSGGTVFTDGADDGAPTIQGKNLRALWADEVGLWRRWQMAWEESIGFAVRIAPAKIIATGTPKVGHPLVKRLIEDASIPKDRLRTLDNLDNLDEGRVNALLSRWQGTTLGQQELEGEYLDQVEGALWTRSMIEAAYLQHGPVRMVDGEAKPDYVRVVVAIDPAVSYGPDADETGIIVAALGPDARGYVLDDLSGRFSPADWAQRAVAAYQQYGADRIVGEVNNGGDMVESTLRGVNPTIAYSSVHATRGKRSRAEPVAGLYETHKITHVHPFPELEGQMLSFTPESSTSPDHLDALVWAIHELMLTGVSYGADVSMIA